MTVIPVDDRANLQSPMSGGEAVVISAADHTPTSTTRALYVGGTGDVKVTLLSGSVVTFGSVPAGAVLAIRASLIWKVGTSATLMVALW